MWPGRIKNTVRKGPRSSRSPWPLQLSCFLNCNLCGNFRLSFVAKLNLTKLLDRVWGEWKLSQAAAARCTPSASQSSTKWQPPPPSGTVHLGWGTKCRLLGLSRTTRWAWLHFERMPTQAKVGSACGQTRSGTPSLLVDSSLSFVSTSFPSSYDLSTLLLYIYFTINRETCCKFTPTNLRVRESMAER